MLLRRLVPGGVILLYHRVATPRTDPQTLAVSPQHFEEHLRVLRREAQLLTVDDFLQAWTAGTLPKRAVLVTFDDGYADNLHSAAPLLEKHGVPALFFLTSATLGGQREFWWDELERIFLQPGTLPGEYPADLPGGPCRLGDDATWSEADFERHAHWNALDPQEPTPRHRLYRLFCQTIREAQAPARDRLVDRLREWAGTPSTGRADHRTLTTEEAARLAATHAIGAHTRTHPLLAVQPAEIQRDEIQGSKSDLEAIIRRPVSAFSYPFGFRGAYSSETMTLARAAGFQAAFANFAEAVRPGSGLFELPRCVVRDWDGAEFAHRLARWWYS